MSHPNDPYGQGGQPGWPGEPGPHAPYQQSQQPYQPDPYATPGEQRPGTVPEGTPYAPQGNRPQGHQPHGEQPPGNPYGQYQDPTSQYPQTRQFPTQQPYGYGQQAGAYGPPGAEQYGGGPYGWGQYGGPPGAPPGTPYGYGPLPPEPPRSTPQHRRTGAVVGSLVAVIALVAAGVATYFLAFAGSAAGASSPKEAAINLVAALSKNDVVGLLDGLAPAEGAVAKDYLAETLDQLKRLEVVKQDTRPEQVTGVTFRAENLVFDDAAEEKVNDHLSITKLVDGTVTVGSDWSKVPLTEKFLKKAFPDGLPANESQTVDVSDEIARSNDGKPVRIATVKAKGKWYPSLFYSVADAALQDADRRWPSTPITANGADSPQAAVRQLVEAALRGDVRRVIELTPPDEAAALHDVGQLIVDEAGGSGQADVTITELGTKVEDVTGGKRVSLTKLSAESGDGGRFTLEVDGDCVKVDDGDERQELCGKDLAQTVADLAELGGTSLTDEQLGAIERIAVGYLHSGLVTTRVDGRWYVSPTRSLGDVSTGFLRQLRPGDLEALIDLGR